MRLISFTGAFVTRIAVCNENRRNIFVLLRRDAPRSKALLFVIDIIPFMLGNGMIFFWRSDVVTTHNDCEAELM